MSECWVFWNVCAGDSCALLVGSASLLQLIVYMQVKEVGWAFDFAYCSGKKKNGESCRNCVNKTKSEFCDWHLGQGHKRLAFGARPECAGTVLGAASYQPGKERETFAHRGKILTKKTAPKTLGAAFRTILQWIYTSSLSLRGAALTRKHSIHSAQDEVSVHNATCMCNVTSAALCPRHSHCGAKKNRHTRYHVNQAT